MKINHIIYIAGLLALAGCSEMEEALTGRVPVTLSQSTVQATPTRAAQNLNEGYIDKGADIDVLIKGADEATYVFTADANDDGKMSPKSTVPYYPATGTVDIYAWYPSGALADFEVSSDQTENAAYQSSDLMVASATGKSKTSGTVALAFDHKMAKLNVNVTAGDGITGITGITLKDVQCKATFTKTGDGIGTVTTVTTDGEHAVSDITMTNNGAVVFPAQTLDGELLAIATPEGTATYAISSKDFEAGHQYTLNITLNNTAVGSTNYINGWSGSGSATVNPAAADQLAIGDISDQTYNGSAIEPTPTVSYNSSVLNSATDYELIYRDNTNAGTATVIAIGKGTYAGKAAAKNFTINKADATYTAPTQKTGLTYTGDEQALANAGTSGHGTFAYCATQNGTYTTTIPTGTNAGSSYAVYWKLTGDSNHNDASGSLTDISIAKATPSVTAPTAKPSLLYTGSAQQLINAGSTTASCTMQYSLDNSTWSSDATSITGTAAQSYTVYYKVVGNDNYNDVAAASITATIVSFPSASSATADDLGKIICSNGHIHEAGSVPSGCTARAIIAYVGATGETGYNHGLAMALSDDSDGIVWNSNSSTDLNLSKVTDLSTAKNNMSGISNTETIISSSTNSAAYKAKTHAVQVTGCSQWFLPSSGQWIKVLGSNGLGKLSDGTFKWNDWFDTSQSSFKAINSALTATGVGGTALTNNAYYWSGSECSANYAVYVLFVSSSGVLVGNGGKSNAYRVRAFLAF